MSSKRIVVAGLLAGFVTIVVVAIVLAAFGPDVAMPAASVPASIAPAASGPVASGGDASGATSEPASSSEASSPTASGSAPEASSSPGDLASAFHVGSPAPALVLPQLGGGRVDLAGLRGRPVWIEFMATWCPSCRDDAAAMTSFSERYQDRGLVAIAVDVREDETTVAAFASSVDGTYPIALDRDGTAARAWSVVGLPTHLFIDSSGIIRAGAIGSVGRDLLARSLSLVMPGTTVTP